VTKLQNENKVRKKKADLCFELCWKNNNNNN
jgi:hypothetical protein